MSFSLNGTQILKMSRTFATLEINITRNGDKIKTFTEEVSCNDDGKDLSTFLSALQNAKESSNGYLTKLVEEDKAHGAEGVVISHSKRKHSDEGEYTLMKIITCDIKCKRNIFLFDFLR